MSRPAWLIECENLSIGWARAFCETARAGVQELSPLVFVLEGFAGGKPAETPDIAQRLDEELRKHGYATVETVANTIFPRRLWNSALPRGDLFRRYRAILPRLHTYSGNQYGLYFERLIGQDGAPNQLEHVLSVYEAGVHRRTALQAAVFTPQRDHTFQTRRGFPCLDHVAFLPMGGGRLETHALYTMQHMLSRAYGNYLGLARLGEFMASEMGLEMSRLVCQASIAKLDDRITKRSIRPIVQTLESLVEAHE